MWKIYDPKYRWFYFIYCRWRSFFYDKEIEDVGPKLPSCSCGRNKVNCIAFFCSLYNKGGSIGDHMHWIETHYPILKMSLSIKCKPAHLLIKNEFAWFRLHHFAVALSSYTTHWIPTQTTHNYSWTQRLFCSAAKITPY